MISKKALSIGNMRARLANRMRYLYTQTVLLSVCFLLSGSIALGNHESSTGLVTNLPLIEPVTASPSQTFPCLPKDVQPDEVVSYGPKGAQTVTVEKKLIEMKARCRGGKLVDTKRREIRFFRLSCWGNPPPDYLEIRQREDEELAKLKRRYTVVVFGCNPMIQ